MMERPTSRLENVRPNASKATSRLPTSTSTTRALLESSQSELNAKVRDDSAYTNHTACQHGKHKITNLPESAPKRKTLAERAGEPLSQSRMQPPLPRLAKAATIAQYAQNKSIGRPHSQIGRPMSAQNGAYRQHNRMNISVDLDQNDEDEEYTLGRRKGMHNISLSLHSPMSPHVTFRKTHNRVRSHERVPSLQYHEPKSTPCAPISAACTKPIAQKEVEDLAVIKEEEANIRQDTDATRRQVSPSTSTLIDMTSSTPAMPLRKRRDETTVFLTKDHTTPVKMDRSLIRPTAIDTQARLAGMDQALKEVYNQMSEQGTVKAELTATIDFLKANVEQLQQANTRLIKEKDTVLSDLERARLDLQTTTSDFHQSRLDHERSQADAERRYERDLHDIKLTHTKQLQQIQREGDKAVGELESEVKDMKHSLQKQKDDAISSLQTTHWDEIERLRVEHDVHLAALRKDLESMKKSGEGRAAESANQVQALRDSIQALEGQIASSHATSDALRTQIASAESKVAALEVERANLTSKAHFLEGNQEAQSQEFTNMTKRLQVAEATAAEATEQLRREETVRRRLNAQILELKGNIRVYARIRPVLGHEEQPAKVEYPDLHELDGKKEMVVHAPTTLTATGKERNEKFSYSFDRVFSPTATNKEVFEECRELVQSVIDGYNVSILSYGQTGSGKTFGMSGTSGIIPSSIEMLLSEIERLKAKGWEYQIEASFVEVYNDTLNDLLGDARTWDNEDDTSSRTRSKVKHEIHHDSLTGQTTVTNLVATPLWPPPEDETSTYLETAVDKILDTAMKNRRVAATKANERSSRSHSIFILSLHGRCEATSETSDGILNLVDLAGSERLKHSGAEGARAKETAAINTSLKSLGDVIEKIGSGGHVPYRNSKLTYLLQSSLGGTASHGKSSRTLMLLHLSPLQAHWQETKTSLQFGVKVHGAHIGAAKKR